MRSWPAQALNGVLSRLCAAATWSGGKPFETTTEPQIEQQELRTIGDCPIKEALSTNGCPGPVTSTWPQFHLHFLHSTALSMQNTKLISKGHNKCGVSADWDTVCMQLALNVYLRLYSLISLILNTVSKMIKKLKAHNKIQGHALKTCPITTHVSSGIGTFCDVMTQGHPWSHIWIYWTDVSPVLTVKVLFPLLMLLLSAVTSCSFQGESRQRLQQDSAVLALSLNLGCHNTELCYKDSWILRKNGEEVIQTVH